MTLLLVGGTCLTLALVLVTISLAGPGRSVGKGQLEAVQHYGVNRVTPSSRKSGASSLSEQMVGIGDRLMATRESTSKTMALIERADLPLRAGEWFVLRVVAVVVAVCAFALYLDQNRLLGIVLGLVVGFVLPSLALRFLSKRRATKFERVLPDVLMLVATSLSSGFSLPQALDAVARDAPEPAAKEFSRALAETRIGTDVGEALERMSVRMGSENMRWTTMSIRIQREVGGNLAETLRTTTKTLRERETLKGQVKALSAEGKLSAYVLIALPIGVFLYMTKVNYQYVELLWTTFYGMVMSGLGILSLGLGVLWMRKVVTIEV